MSSKTFTMDDLREMVNLVGAEFEREDCLIRESTTKNVAYDQCRGQGITYLRNEKYYQFAAVRALMPTFRFRVRPEYRRFDLALFSKSSQEAAAVGEIKLYMRGGPEEEIRGMREDLKKLAREQCAAFLLVFTANPPGKTTENLRFLLDKLGGLNDTALYRFATSLVFPDGPVREGEFAILAALLTQGQIVAAPKAQG